VAAAEAEARSIVTKAAQAADQKLADAKEALEKIQAERDSVEVYLRNLRSVLQGN
jgi:hypothetical protein